MRPIQLAAVLLACACVVITCQGELPAGSESGSQRGGARKIGPIRGLGHKVARFLRLPWARGHSPDGCMTVDCLVESNRALMREIESLRTNSKSAQLQGMLDSEMSTSADLAKTLEGLRQRISDLNAEVSAKNAVERERDSLEILYRDITKKLTAAESRAARLAEELSESKESNAKAVADMSASHESAIAQLTGELQDKDAEVKRIKEALGASASAAHALEQRITEVEAANKALEESLAEATLRAKNLEAGHADALREATAEANVAAGKAKADSTKALEAAHKERDDAISLASSLEQDTAKHKAALDEQISLRSEVESALSSARGDLELAEASIAENKVELDRLMSLRDASAAEQTKLIKALSDAEALAASQGGASGASLALSVIAALILGGGGAALAVRRSTPAAPKRETAEGHTQTAAPKQVLLSTQGSQCATAQVTSFGVQAVASTSGVEVQATTKSCTSGSMTEPPQRASFATMTSPIKERQAIMALQTGAVQEPAPLNGSVPKVQAWLTPRGSKSSGAGSLFSPDCAPQCRKDTPPASPDAADKLVISPTTYRAEPMEADDLPVSVHDNDDCVSVSSITSKLSDTVSVSSRRSDRTTASKASTRSARSRTAGKENSDPQSGASKVGGGGLKNMLGGAHFRSAARVFGGGRGSSNVAGSSLSRGDYVDTLLEAVSP